MSSQAAPAAPSADPDWVTRPWRSYRLEHGHQQLPEVAHRRGCSRALKGCAHPTVRPNETISMPGVVLADQAALQPGRGWPRPPWAAEGVPVHVVHQLDDAGRGLGLPARVAAEQGVLRSRRRRRPALDALGEGELGASMELRVSRLTVATPSQCPPPPGSPRSVPGRGWPGLMASTRGAPQAAAHQGLGVRGGHGLAGWPGSRAMDRFGSKAPGPPASGLRSAPGRP